MKILKEVDPVGADCRRRERIKRKVYQSVGPNFVWHVDGQVLVFLVIKLLYICNPMI